MSNDTVWIIRGRCADSLQNATRSSLYSHRLQQSEEFCLMISGDTPSSRRLFDAFAHGAVPIIISNRLWHVAMPFPVQVSRTLPPLGPGCCEHSARRVCVHRSL